MRCVDVNVLVYAHRPESPDHDRYLHWLDVARSADEPLGLSPIVLSGFLRVVTHPRIFREPTPLEVALEAVAVWRATPNALELTAGDRHFDIFTRMCRGADARGNLIPDAYLAALAVERGATWYSADRSFARFADLDHRHPLDDQVAR
ncbi:MAG: type II toxin-antitoxin system VapC family toxin [Actinobacteria bacterium]|nr:type II toxin-antitoxin system VapC family toxin [Actinomycetota bacterium]